MILSFYELIMCKFRRHGHKIKFLNVCSLGPNPDLWTSQATLHKNSRLEEWGGGPVGAAWAEFPFSGLRSTFAQPHRIFLRGLNVFCCFPSLVILLPPPSSAVSSMWNPCTSLFSLQFTDLSCRILSVQPHRMSLSYLWQLAVIRRKRKI